MFLAGYVLLWLAIALYVALLFRGGGRLRCVASAAAALSWLCLMAGLAARGLAAGHWPLTNRYEYAWWFAWSIVGLYLLLELRWRECWAGAGVMAAALVVATYALLRPAEEVVIRPLLPALRSVWLQFHVLTAAVGYGAGGVGAGLALVRLLLPARLRRGAIAKVTPDCVSNQGLGDGGTAEPEAGGTVLEALDRNVERVLGWGFPWLTLGILTGAIWAQDAWGRYWGWDPKETWALVTWLWYLMLLHLRGLRRWRGQRMAWLTLVGFVLILFTLAGLPWLLRTVRLVSLHGF